MHHILNFRLFAHTCHANLTDQCLLNVYFSMTDALNNPSPPPFHSLPPMLFQKPCLYYSLFSSFSHSLFHFKLYKNLNWSHSNWDFMACKLINYIGFQIKLVGTNQMKLLIQCHNLYFLRSRTWLYTIFIGKTNLIVDLLNFNIFESSEYEKMDIFFKNS